MSTPGKWLEAMPEHKPSDLKHHIEFSGKAAAEGYTHPRAGGRTPFRRRQIDCVRHAETLLRDVAQARTSFEETVRTQSIADSELSDYGLILNVESEPDYPLKVESLERKRDGIELLNVRHKSNPDGRKTTFATGQPTKIFWLTFETSDWRPLTLFGPTTKASRLHGKRPGGKCGSDAEAMTGKPRF